MRKETKRKIAMMTLKVNIIAATAIAGAYGINKAYDSHQNYHKIAIEPNDPNSLEYKITNSE